MRASRFNVKHGSAAVKGYIVTSIELWGLGGLGLLASLAFSAGASCLTFAINTAQSIDLSPGVEKEAYAYWSAAGDFAELLGIGLLVFGILSVLCGSLYIRHILHRTKFDDMDDHS